MGSFARTLFSRTLLARPVLCQSGQILHSKVLEHFVCSNTSGFRFGGLLARTSFWLALCGLPCLRAQDTQILCDQKSLSANRTAMFEMDKHDPPLWKFLAIPYMQSNVLANYDALFWCAEPLIPIPPPPPPIKKHRDTKFCMGGVCVSCKRIVIQTGAASRYLKEVLRSGV